MKELLFALLVVGSASHTGVVKAKLYADASRFCAKEGKKVVQANDNAVGSSGGRSTGTEIQFHCK